MEELTVNAEQVLGVDRFGPVEYVRRGRVAIFTMRRPEVRNAINPEMARGLEDCIDRAERDPDVWVTVIAGEGSVFCSGADLKVIASGGGDAQVTERGGFAGLVWRKRDKPMIAAVDGLAYAGGCEIALACDLIVASTNAKFALPEVRRALVAAAGGLFRLPRVIPRNIAMEMALTAEPIDGETAHRWGLVNRLTEPGKVVDAALELAERICTNAPLAVRETRKVVLDGPWMEDEAAFRLSQEAVQRMYSTEDFNEGPKAFLEKREPVWTGR